MKKRAVIIGINYTGTHQSLGGCINDAIRMASLVKSHGYTVLLLTDKIRPTYENICESFNWLLHDCDEKAFGKSSKYNMISPGTTLYFHFSGHGVRTKDKNVVELDQPNRAIITHDNKILSDDYIYKNLISKLPEGVKLRGSMDCCNSRTNFDLRWTLGKVKNSFVLEKTGSGRNSYCDVIIVSGASDGGKSYDAIINGVRTGVLTHYYLKIMEEHNYELPVNILLDQLEKKIQNKGYRQSPGICFGKYMDIATIFSL